MFCLEMCTERIIVLRKERGYTQEQIGKILNLSKQAINEIEKGRVKISFINACLLAEFYGVSLDYLAGNTELRNYVDKIAPTLAKEEELILKNFRLLDDISKGKLIERSRILLEESSLQANEITKIDA